MFAHVDINKFYANSIRSFMPELIGKPLIVLSNNDGCAICVSECDAFGLKMGANFYEVENIVNAHSIHVFSSNYTHFADMSLRVKSLIRRFFERYEDYSVDEVFIDMQNGTSEQHVASCQQMRKLIAKGLGLPNSIGIAPTMTLSKVATRYAKRHKAYDGVCIIDTDEKREKALKMLPIGSVWGIGYAHEERLKKIGVKTAWDFTRVPKNWVRNQMTITGEKTWRELRGEACIDLVTEQPDKKSITVSRSFGKDIYKLDTIASAVTAYTCMAAAKLRKQKSVCKEVLLFIETNRFKEYAKQYARNILIRLPVATNFDMEINQYVQEALKKIYQTGYGFKKAGVILMNISPANVMQGSLFDTVDRKKLQNATYSIDYLNERYGRNTVIIGTQGFDGEWNIKQERLCPCFTTRMKDFPKAV